MFSFSSCTHVVSISPPVFDIPVQVRGHDLEKLKTVSTSLFNPNYAQLDNLCELKAISSKFLQHLPVCDLLREFPCLRSNAFWD